METISDWKLASKQIEDYLTSRAIGAIDFLLVGSKVDNEASYSDFDSIIIIDNFSSEISDLRNLRKSIEKFILSNEINQLYHFKLFNQQELYYLAIYDAFRLADFKRRNLSLNGSGILNSVQPKFNRESFCNSFLIQLVHKFIYQLDKPNIEEIHSKLNYWIEFNLGIKQIMPRNSATFQFFIESDWLISEFWTFFHTLPHGGDNNKLRELLESYFLKIRHESINKYNEYFSIIS